MSSSSSNAVGIVKSYGKPPSMLSMSGGSRVIMRAWICSAVSCLCQAGNVKTGRSAAIFSPPSCCVYKQGQDDFVHVAPLDPICGVEGRALPWKRKPPDVLGFGVDHERLGDGALDRRLHACVVRLGRCILHFCPDPCTVGQEGVALGGRDLHAPLHICLFACGPDHAVRAVSLEVPDCEIEINRGAVMLPFRLSRAPDLRHVKHGEKLFLRHAVTPWPLCPEARCQWLRPHSVPTQREPGRPAWSAAFSPGSGHGAGASRPSCRPPPSAGMG